jgi:hypothetical protein
MSSSLDWLLDDGVHEGVLRKLTGYCRHSWAFFLAPFAFILGVVAILPPTASSVLNRGALPPPLFFCQPLKVVLTGALDPRGLAIENLSQFESANYRECNRNTAMLAIHYIERQLKFLVFSPENHKNLIVRSLDSGPASLSLLLLLRFFCWY